MKKEISKVWLDTGFIDLTNQKNENKSDLSKLLDDLNNSHITQKILRLNDKDFDFLMIFLRSQQIQNKTNTQH